MTTISKSNNQKYWISSDIALLYSTKQNIISSSNKLDVSKIGLGSVTNTVFDYI